MKQIYKSGKGKEWSFLNEVSSLSEDFVTVLISFQYPRTGLAVKMTKVWRDLFQLRICKMIEVVVDRTGFSFVSMLYSIYNFNFHPFPSRK